jgi:hypothetical protein
MTDQKQILIDKAQERFLNGDVAEFSAILKDLYYSYITCNCFLRNQPKALWESLLNKAKSLKDNEADFDLNFAKGFIFKNNNNAQEAFKCLTVAIELNPLSDICYSLRATLEDKINPSRLDDAKEAVLLNPSARNYFILANSYDDKNLENAINYYKKTTSLNGKFACAFNNLALRYKSLKDYKSAVSSFLKCIAIEKNHWCYYELWFCLEELKDYENALQYIQEGHSQHPEDLNYYFALGVANERLNKHKEAIEFYNLYQSYYPNSYETYIWIAITNISNKLLEKAISEYSQDNFTNSLNSFDEYLRLDEELSYENLITYFKATLKSKDPKIEFGELNPHYSRLSSLNEENINKLMIYQSHFKIGFGKYDGSTIQEIINIDSHYIVWCIINLSHFSISPALFLQESFKNEIDYLEALEINLIKIELVDMWMTEAINIWNMNGYTADHNFNVRSTDYDDYQEDYPSYEEWLEDEFGDDAETAYWNMD